MYAGELETSILLGAYPAYVRDGWNATDHSAPDRRYLTALGIHAYTETGVIGQPSQATREKGLDALDHLGTAAEPSLASSHRCTTKNCAVAAPVRWRSRPPPRTDQPYRYEPPPSRVLGTAL
jgi:hypothetical protein